MVSAFFGASKKISLLQIVIWILVIALHTRSVSEHVPPQWIIWNVGQGSWITRIEDKKCIHFDAGGEGRAPTTPFKYCRYRENLIYFSHSDWDHVSFAKTLRNSFYKLCRIGPWDTNMFEDIATCSFQDVWTWKPKKAKTPNDSSAVFYYQSLLYPGDSPKKFEKYWVNLLPARPKVLVLAHHGSRTGTSKEILTGVTDLKMAIASARQSKYGHPHWTVQQRLKRANIPMLTTEAWGNIHILDE